MSIYRAVLLLSAVLLFLATLSALSLPDGYFTVLRFVVFSTALYAAYQHQDRFAFLLGLLMVAVLFNPLEPIVLSGPAGNLSYLAAAAAFLRLAFHPLKTQDE